MDDSGLAGAVEQIRAAMAAPDSEPTGLLHAIETLRDVRATLEAWEPELITAARARGLSWADIAPALGVASRQAAERRYLRGRSAVPTDGSPRAATREDRVRAERTRRAGERAVNTWARDNSSTLRQLAGRVSATTGLSESGQASTGQVRTALGSNDAADLLAPLADAREHLLTDHAGLAAEILDVTEMSSAVRRETERRREDLES